MSNGIIFKYRDEEMYFRDVVVLATYYCTTSSNNLACVQVQTPCRRFGIVNFDGSWHLFVQSQQWKHQGTCEICSKLTIKTLECCH